MDEEDEPELPEEIAEAINLLSDSGNALMNEGKFGEAAVQFWQAWELLPDPKTEWEAATWILAALADAAFFQRDFARVRETLALAMHCPGAIGNPFVHLRLGQAQLELGDLDAAADELMRAYMSEGAEIFAAEEPKYLAFLRTRAAID